MGLKSNHSVGGVGRAHMLQSIDRNGPHGWFDRRWHEPQGCCGAGSGEFSEFGLSSEIEEGSL